MARRYKTPDYKTPGVFIQEIPTQPRPIAGIGTSATVFVGPAAKGPLNQAIRISAQADFARQFGGPSPDHPLAQAIDQYFLNGGRNATVVRVGRDAYPAGLRALKKIESFDLLVLAQPAPGRDVEFADLQAALICCREHRAVLLVDPRNGWSSPKDVLDRRSGIGSLNLRDANAALYYPNLLLPDPANPRRQCSSPPSGTIAGLIARTDEMQGVWKAPAGILATLNGVIDLEHTLAPMENRLLNEAGVNCLRAFPKTGPVSWGARTLAGADIPASEWKYLPVRRTALFVEKSLTRGLQWAVFEPNDANLWTAIRASVENFLRALFADGAFQGASAKEAYFVKCDATTTTAQDVNLGRVNVTIGFAPLRPAEFVILQIAQKAGQSPP